MKKASFIISFLFINAIGFAQDSADLHQQSAANKFGSTGDIIFFILFGAFLLSIILFAKPAKDGMFLGSVYLGLKGDNQQLSKTVWGDPYFSKWRNDRDASVDQVPFKWGFWRNNYGNDTSDVNGDGAGGSWK